LEAEWLGPQHDITRYMSFERFIAIKKYFHISEPYTHLPRCRWFLKLQYLANLLQKKFQEFIIPETWIAVNEQVVRFTGRSVHTVVIPNKSIPVGYKILALCGRGYTFTFPFTP
jgi:hypothetical protein